MKNVETFAAIAERYENLDIPDFTPEARLTTIMDLQVVGVEHPEANFEILLNFPVGDFCHDIFGIKRHINRQTAIIEDCFVPRFVDASR
jgi:hypothetical protein